MKDPTHTPHHVIRAVAISQLRMLAGMPVPWVPVGLPVAPMVAHNREPAANESTMRDLKD